MVRGTCIKEMSVLQCRAEGLMKIQKIALVLLSFAVCSCTINRITEKERTITVTGKGSIDLFAERRIMEFTVLTTAWTAKQVVADNDVISDRFINALKEVGVAAGDISRGDVTVTNPAQNYEGRRSVLVTIQKPALIPSIIDCKTASIRMRQTYETYPTELASDIRRVQSMAVQNAQDIAGLLTGASGTRIGMVSHIGDEKIEISDPVDGKKTLTCTLTITYDLMQ